MRVTNAVKQYKQNVFLQKDSHTPHPPSHTQLIVYCCDLLTFSCTYYFLNFISLYIIFLFISKHYSTFAKIFNGKRLQTKPFVFVGPIPEPNTKYFHVLWLICIYCNSFCILYLYLFVSCIYFRFVFYMVLKYTLTLKIIC